MINWRFAIFSDLRPIDFPLTFIIWYGSNKHLKEFLIFQTKLFYSKNPFLLSVIRKYYSSYLILHLLVQWYRAQNVQVTVSTLKSIELLCLPIKPFLSWYLRPQTRKTQDFSVRKKFFEWVIRYNSTENLLLLLDFCESVSHSVMSNPLWPHRL